ncbi:MAG: recombination protein RecR [Candidatus Omnitrophota bacterium]|jgi:recombination protein RecR
MSQSGNYPECMQTLIEELSKMPGVGTRTAERLAFYILGSHESSAKRLASSIQLVKETIRYCRDCFNLTDRDICSICYDVARDKQCICVVSEPKEIISIEKAGAFRGIYHVLFGSLSPLDGIGPNDIKIPELIARVDGKDINEIVLAMSSNTEGEATALYIAKALKPFDIKVTRLAQGIPLGSDLEFADRATLTKAMEARYTL